MPPERSSPIDDAESELRRDAELVALSSDGIVVRNLDGIIKSWSRGAERLYGWPRELAIGSSCHDLLGTMSPDHMAEAETALRRDGHWQGKLEQRRRDGSKLWTASRWVLEVTPEQGSYRVLESNTDITDQCRAEEALKDSEYRLRLAVDGLQLGTWEAALATGELRMSDRCKALFGMSPDTPVDAVQILTRIHPDDVEIVNAAFAAAMEPGSDGAYFAEYRTLLADGDGCRWVQSNGLVTIDALGKPLRIIGTTLDISDRKHAEQALNAAKDEAEASNRAKSAFLANMSHEIRTPLGAILGYTELLLRQEGGPEDQQKFLETISRNGQQLAALIDDILDLSKVEAGKVTVECLPVSLPAIIGEVVDLHSLRARDKNITLTAVCHADVPQLVATDPVRLRQILTNVVGNAVKFTDTGGVKLDVRALPGRTRDEARIAFRVVDTGRGMAPAEQGRLFQAFTQADDATTRKYGGTGLGLVLSRRLARLLGGDLRLSESQIGRGSTFVVTISAGLVRALGPQVSPAPYLPRPDLAADDAARKLSLKGVRILLAEDVVENQTLISHILTRQGAEVELASDGAQAVQQALKSQPDVVLMDIQMPVLDGYGATAELRKLGFKRPIVALTAHAMKEERGRCLESGCNDQLTKPISPAGLIQAVSRFARGPKHLH